jgi:DEAD/DEAH box helicase domain-containing protein
MSCVSHWETLPAKPGSFVEFPADLHPRLRGALERRGITRLYTHQATCFAHARKGRHLVVVTPTASGKTLSYNLPVLQWLLEHPEARAMYLFPTKALSQDQQAELNEVVLFGDLGIKVFTYDGDTPASIRMSARDQGQLVITNPDMLHSGILPNHPKWIKFLGSLKFVVIDEIHSYRGVFGSHLTNLFRRLKRVLSFYGASPTFICCSATIGNPKDLTERLIEEQVVLVDENGSPSGERHFVLYNPPLVDPVQGIRRGVVLESQALATRLLQRGVKTIVFARSRIRTELIASYIRDNLRNHYTRDHPVHVASYRGGYLPNERRRIEKGLREGTIRGVVSTNALELGIDIGGLDASILAGFPGSFASSWQQAGRAGRTSAVSLSVLMASASPLDQYIITHPEYFFSRSPESGWVDPDNLFILLDQLKCAVFELPFEQGESFRADVGDLLGYLEENGVVHRAENRWYWSDRSYPAEKVSLRTSTPENVIIINTTAGKDSVIGEMDLSAAKMQLYDNAIYMHLGDQFVVKRLDLENRKCFVEESRVNYYTDSIVKSDIKVLHVDHEEVRAGIQLSVTDILVRSAVTKFKKLKFRTHENIGYGEVNLPEDEMHTRSIVLGLDDGLASGRAFAQMAEHERGVVLRRMGYLVQNVAPVFLLCDARDLGIAERLRDPELGRPCLFVYDNYPGGTGLSEGFLANVEAILAACTEVVAGCGCRDGCPSCIGPPDTGSDAGSAGAAGVDAKRLLVDFLTEIRS